MPRRRLASLLLPAIALAACGSAQKQASAPVAPVARTTTTSTAPAPAKTTVTVPSPRPKAPPARAATTAKATAKTQSTTAAAKPVAEDGASASGAPSDAEIRAELREAYGGEAGTDLDLASLSSDGTAGIPATAPSRLAALMQGANEVALKAYVYGGGHGRNPNEIWSDSAYDCSGSISYALAAAGYIDGPMDSGSLARWGKPGPGKWVTIYANAGHAFMVVAGLRYDTSGRQRTGTRWQPAGGRSYAGFTVRHPPGL
jgi:cell wall-associated NlpC family hydrolase